MDWLNDSRPIPLVPPVTTAFRALQSDIHCCSFVVG